MKPKTIDSPFGWYMEEVAKLSDDQKQRTAVHHSLRLGGYTRIVIWPNRRAIAKTIRLEEKDALRSEWNPLVPLSDGEGY